MAAYAAVVSLVQILHPHQFPLHLRNPEIESLYSKVLSLQSILEKIFPVTKNIRQGVRDLDGRIREAIYRAQDEIETFIIRHTLSSENVLKEIIAEIDPLSAQAKKIASSIKKLEMASSPAVYSLSEMLHPESFPLDHLTSHVKSLYERLCFLQSCLEKICDAPNSTITVAVHALDIQIREAASQAQNTIESFIWTQTESSTSAFLQILQEITANIDPLVEEVEKVVDSIERDLQQAQDSLSKNIAQTSKEDSRTKKKQKKIVGQEEDLEKLKEEIRKPTNERQVLPIIGLPGSGKTTVARSIYEDSSITDEFEIQGWVTVTQDYQMAEIFSKLFHSLETKGQKPGTQLGRNGNLQDAVYQSLLKTKYLIVVDDIWAADVWDRLKLSFPNDNNGSRIVVTTRSKDVAMYAQDSFFLHVMNPLSRDHSWELLTLTVFEEGESCPPHLKDIGRKISRNCNGLPLSLIVIGALLSKEKKTEEYWKNIEGDTSDAAAKGDDAYLEILYLSYYSLPGELKGCFLYMGAFPENSEILANKLIQLWVAEGFLKPHPSLVVDVEQVARYYLEQLIDRNLLEVHKFTSKNQTKSCGMNNSLRNLALKECRSEKFFHSRRKYVQELPEGTNAQRRISVHRNVLMCVEQVHNSVKQITFARTLLFVGAHHHHPLPYCLTFDLLRVLDALTIYFVGFPNEIVKLIHLRYLSLTYNRKLPSTLSNLRKLQILIVRQNPKLIFLGKSILPDEIWGMTQLRHLLISETDLPKIPAQNSFLFANLQTLSNVSAASCTKEVLQNMPNLKKLSMWTESPGPVGLYLDQLEKLESFKFTVLNPIPKEKVEFLPQFYFPGTLRKLRLSGCSLPWQVMTVIGHLPFLEVLKLREIAFEGDDWRPKRREFRQLKFLLLEYLDLKNWVADHNHFLKLERLILRHCYELVAIPIKFTNIGCLELIELVDCSLNAVESAEEMKVNVNNSEIMTNLKIRTYSSWK